MGHLYDEKLNEKNNTVLKERTRISAIIPYLQTKFQLQSVGIIVLLLNGLMWFNSKSTEVSTDKPI